MDISNVGLGLAFLAGLASFLSPCVFSLVPAYIGYLGGRTITSDNRFEDGQQKWLTFTHGMAFVMGFSVIFIVLGVATSALGSLLFDLRPLLAKIGGVVVVIFGLHLAHIIRIPFLEYDLRAQSTPDDGRGYISSALMGIFFSAGWSPCVGPVLGAILTFSLSGGSVTLGASLLTAYSAGMAIPFLIAAIGIGWVTNILQRYGRVLYYVEIAMGVLMVVVGVMLFLGTFEQLARFGFFVDFGL